MSDMSRGSVVRWWAILAAGTAASILIAWLARLSGVQLRTVLSIAAGGAALAWLVVLLAMPWNLYFAARRVMTQIAVSRDRGIPRPRHPRDRVRASRGRADRAADAVVRPRRARGDRAGGRRDHPRVRRQRRLLRGRLLSAVGDDQAGRTQSRPGAKYRRLARRMPKNKALVATGNSMLAIIHALLPDPAARYTDLGADYYEQRMHARR